MENFKYYIAKEKYYFTLFVDKNEDEFLAICSITINNPIWGHKKKSCRCILRSFYNCVGMGMIISTKKETVYKHYTIIKSELIAKDLLIEKFPQLKQYGELL